MGQALAIELHSVGVLRGGRWILRGINWSVEAGTLVAILGPNGSGKSTLARIIAGHLWPTSGECTVLGGKFGQANLPELRKRIRLVQAAGPYDVDGNLSAREVVLTGFFGSIGLYGKVTDAMRQHADELLAQVGLGNLAGQTYALMSSGERVRSLIARAMTTRPGLMVLDEPTAGLDLLARERVLATIQKLIAGPEAPAVVLITHHVEELPPATQKVLLLKEGQAAASGTMDEVLRAELLSEVYGFAVKVRKSAGRFYLEIHPDAWEGLLDGGRKTV